MSVRCKFKVNTIEHHDGNGVTIKMSPTTSADPNSENAKFWKWTPGGSLVFNCVNPDAIKQLELGKEYYLDISPAPEPQK